jgi:hypothetical protein
VNHNREDALVGRVAALLLGQGHRQRLVAQQERLGVDAAPRLQILKLALLELHVQAGLATRFIHGLDADGQPGVVGASLVTRVGDLGLR